MSVARMENAVRAGHLFGVGGLEHALDSCPPRLKPWATRGDGRRHGRRRGYLLLEVVLSIALLLLGLTYIGAQVQKSQESSRRGDDLTRVMMLAESKMAELDTGLVPLDQEADNEVEGDFTLRFPNYGWRFRVQDTATEQLRAITLEVLYARRASLDDPFDVDNAEVVYSVHTLRADPAVLDVEVDLGLDEDAVADLSDKLPPGVFDPPFLPPAAFKDLDFDTLVELLPDIIAMFGDGAAPLLASLPPDMRALLNQPTGAPGASQGTQPGTAPNAQPGTAPNAPQGQGAAPTGLSDDDLNLFNQTREQFDRGGGLQQPTRGNDAQGQRANRPGRGRRPGRSGQAASGGRGKGGR